MGREGIHGAGRNTVPARRGRCPPPATRSAAKTDDNYPAPKAIMSAVYEGLQVPIDTGLAHRGAVHGRTDDAPVEPEHDPHLVQRLRRAQKLASRPKGVPQSNLKKIAVLGAGMMGAGIAYVSAQAGLDVVLIDSNEAAAAKGKSYSEALLDGAIAKGRATAATKAAVLDRIAPTTAYGACAIAIWSSRRCSRIARSRQM